MTDTIREARERGEKALNFALDDLADIRDRAEKAEGEAMALREEIVVLRSYGNKDCTHQADEELARRAALVKEARAALGGGG